ncbi:uncharacterized protein LOC119572564 [Penaeus monodon]|uniref:uncharacterized protein LOC119572564 n=1 Tax=Penaeus monodon TaxID=6687 RepID=UPI0018A70E7B|nr:uncharacterized protein LOC119572564 [Penaeus monodon]
MGLHSESAVFNHIRITYVSMLRMSLVSVYTVKNYPIILPMCIPAWYQVGNIFLMKCNISLISLKVNIVKSYILSFVKYRSLQSINLLRLEPPVPYQTRYQGTVIVDVTDKQTTIEGLYKPSDRTELLVKTEHTECGACPLCALQLNLKHTDVLVLSQFLRSDGCMLPKRITGLCNSQQKKVTLLVAMAQKAGLMPNLAPYWSKKDPKKRFGSKKFNRYFDEETLNIRI